MDVLKFIAIGLGILFIIIATSNSPDNCIGCGGEDLGECHKCGVYKRKIKLEEKNERFTDR